MAGRQAPPRPYADPYVAGVGLGLVLLAAFVLAGRGLGASGAFARVATRVVTTVDPGAATRPYFAGYTAAAGEPSGDWLLAEIVGVLIGGGLSALAAGRWRYGVEAGAGVSVVRRTSHAAAGGLLMGAGAVLARGCTSGQALTGGALLSVGSWLFMVGAFAAGYAVAPLTRRAWR